MQVLVADDSRNYRLVLKRYLKQFNHEVIEAKNGLEATELFEQHGHSLDLIFMDVEMPVMDGIEATSRIRTLQDKKAIEWVPVIFLSASDDDNDLEISIVSGGDDYLIKPVSKTVLSAKMLAMQRITNMRSRLVEANEELRLLATTDPLTGIANRRQFELLVTAEIKRACRDQQPLGYILFDVDHFKRINDTYGHDVGDQVLVAICQGLQFQLRDNDVLGRVGGEEFGILVVDSNPFALKAIAERYRHLIENQQTAMEPETSVQVTASFGCTCLANEQESYRQLYNRADEALYRAKNEGRNRVVLQTDYARRD